MIDLYTSDGENTCELIQQLAQEVEWPKFELLRKVRELTEGHLGKSVWQLTLDALLDKVADKDLTGDFARGILHNLIDDAPFHVILDNLDDRDGCVLVTCKSAILATHDQSISGARWEIPGDMDIAYAMPGDNCNLLEELKNDGYIVNDDEYCPPENNEEPHGNQNRY